MVNQIIDKIRDAIRNDNYNMTRHAMEEIAEDELGIYDIENAILNGDILRREKDDPRGTKYIIEGRGLDKAVLIGVVGRFKETGVFLIITVYKII